jgi:universal stress protein E
MLVVIDPNQDDQPALRRAVYLHQRIGGRIKAFLPIYDFSYEMTTLLSPDERTAMRQGVIGQRSAWIKEQARFYIESGMPIDIKVVWHNRPFEAIIQEILSDKHDLLLKMAHQHDKLEAVIFTPTDWHLLRKCPCPVWMVKDQPWPEGGKALVAVNLASEENYHDALNEKLVKETLELADQVNHTEVHLVGAYPVTPINIAIELPDFDPSIYNDAIRGQHLLAMKALRQKFGIDENRTHVEKGLPEEVIPDLSEHLQAGIVVLGTVGRTGLSAAFSAIPPSRLSTICAATCWFSSLSSTKRRLKWMTRTTINPRGLMLRKTFPCFGGGFFSIHPAKKQRAFRPRH